MRVCKPLMYMSCVWWLCVYVFKFLCVYVCLCTCVYVYEYVCMSVWVGEAKTEQDIVGERKTIDIFLIFMMGNVCLSLLGVTSYLIHDWSSIGKSELPSMTYKFSLGKEDE